MNEIGKFASRLPTTSIPNGMECREEPPKDTAVRSRISAAAPLTPPHSDHCRRRRWLCCGGGRRRMCGLPNTMNPSSSAVGVAFLAVVWRRHSWASRRPQRSRSAAASAATVEVVRVSGRSPASAGGSPRRCNGKIRPWALAASLGSRGTSARTTSRKAAVRKLPTTVARPRVPAEEAAVAGVTTWCARCAGARAAGKQIQKRRMPELSPVSMA